MTVILTPKEAYELIRQKQFKTVKESRISQHFTWGEVFANCDNGEIASTHPAIFENALRQSVLMEKIRRLYGKPVIVHSWYRNKQHNERVGGAKESYHLKGLATDFHIQGYESAVGNRQVQIILDESMFMQRAGLEFTGGEWTHVDSRGYKARFGKGM